MASQLVISQLSKPLALNAAGIVPPAATPVPTALLNRHPQPPFPVYHPGPNAPQAGAWMPPRPANGQGSAHPFQMVSEFNMHPVLFQMESYPGLYNNIRVPLLVNLHTGMVERGNNGIPLRYFSHLPRWVAQDVSGLLMEFWMRLDPRVEMQDIIGRINLAPGKRMPVPNTFNMRRTRFRTIINVPAFSTGRPSPAKPDVDMISLQTREQFLLNTAMVVDIANHRLLVPILNGRHTLGYVDSGLPMDYFLRGFQAPVHIPSDRQIVSLELRKRLQTLAIRLNLGTSADNYDGLQDDCHPVSWHKGSNGSRVIHEIDGLTHANWMDVLCQAHPGLSRSGLQRPANAPVAAAPIAGPALPPPAPAGPQANLAIDPRLLNGTWAAVPPVQPQSQANEQGGYSHYVEG